MNKEIGTILKGRLVANGGLPFVDLIAGVAQRVSFKEANGDGNPVTKTMPVSYDHDAAQGCSTTPEKALIPDSKRKGILYFEDGGAVYTGKVGGDSISYRSTLVLICWMNRALLVGDAYKEITSYCITSILGKLKVERPTNEGNFTRFNISPGRILPQDASVFNRYTYDETITQYLRPPFEFFGMELTVEYAIHPSCLNQIEFKEKICY